MESGSIVTVDYSLWNADNGDLIETTLESVAAEHDQAEGRKFRPLVAVVGGGKLIEGFEEHLKQAEPGADYEVEIIPEQGYGVRDSKLIETVSLDKLVSHVRDPKALAVGAPVEYNGRNGVLALVAAGRARIDFNHPLAGRTLRYTYRITSAIEDRAERVRTLIEVSYGREGFEAEFSDDDLTITLPEAAVYDHNWMMAKFTLIRELRDHVGAQSITFREVHEPRAAVELDHDHDHDHGDDAEE